VLETGGLQAAQIARLFWIFAGVGGVVWGGITIATGRSLRLAESAANPALHGRLVRAVAIAAVMTVITLFVLLFLSVRTGRAVNSVGVPARTVKVVGHKWWWEFQYDPSLPSRVVTANELHLPLGTPVLLQLESQDVIHSFWVPALHGKKDLVPGKPGSLVIRADTAGTYAGRCAEFCGLQHANMGFTVVAEDRARFDSWLAHQAEPGAEPATPEQERGRQVFLGTRCAFCHTVAGSGARGVVGPDLTHVASRQRVGAGALPNTRGHLAGWVVDSQALKPGNLMPPTLLHPDELQPLLDYLESLR
jgi:cytochrome c oxidase subunit 2